MIFLRVCSISIAFTGELQVKLESVSYDVHI